MKYFNTIADMEKFYYGDAYDLFKDAEIDVAETGVRNILFGRKLWEQVVVAANTFGVLAKKPFDKGGYRAITAAAATTTAGVAENAAIPATLKPTFAEISLSLKELASSFEMSAKESAVEGKDDTVYWADIVEYMGKEYQNRLNRDLLADVEDGAAGNALESIDRVCSSAAEEAAVAGLADGEADIYSLDRTSASWTDAYVSHNSATARYLSLSQIDTVLANVRPYWDDPSSVTNKVFITGHDTLVRWSQLMAAQQMYQIQKVQFTVNGIKTVGTNETGLEVASYKGIPIIADNNVTQDTLSRIYLIDLDHVFISVAKPIQYMESEDYQALNKFTKEGVFYMVGELVANKFKGCGKVRDLK